MAAHIQDNGGDNRKGLFIVFEGLEASGKTTQIDLAFSWLKTQNHHVIKTREPGGTPLGLELRRILLHDPKEQPGAVEEILMFLLDRTVHLRKVVTPALQRGNIVLCDRYHYSTLAYQEISCSALPPAWQAISWELVGNQKPDLVVLMDIDPDVSFSRIPSGSLDKIERRGRDYFHRVRARFLEQAQADPARFLVLDASRDRQQLHLLFQQRLQDLLTPTSR